MEKQIGIVVVVQFLLQRKIKNTILPVAVMHTRAKSGLVKSMIVFDPLV